jgi:CDP-diacylglycerol--glycerol-3-phosphate 3-phosphatidyltransferase/cardiolipin synthase
VKVAAPNPVDLTPPALFCQDVTILPRALVRRGPWSLPNLLTYGRIIAVPAVVGLLFWPHDEAWRWLALAIYIVAAVTDYLDGWLARAWSQHSAIGRMLDPIADKLLVSSCLLMLVHTGDIQGVSTWAAIVILCREILVSGLREFLAELKVSVPVSQVAKWKTALQLVAVGFLIAGPAGDNVIPPASKIGIALLWAAAILTIYTGWDYFQAGIKHLVEEDERDG